MSLQNRPHYTHPRCTVKEFTLPLHRVSVWIRTRSYKEGGLPYKASRELWPYGPCCCSRCLRGGRPGLYEAQDDPSIFFLHPPPLFPSWPSVAITAPAHARSHSRPFFGLSFTYEQQRQSAFERTPILGAVEAHATPPHHIASSCLDVGILKRGIIDAIGIDTDGRQPRCLHPRVRERLVGTPSNFRWGNANCSMHGDADALSFSRSRGRLHVML